MRKLATPLNPERHSEILVEDAVSVPDEIKVQFVISEYVNLLTPCFDVLMSGKSITHF